MTEKLYMQDLEAKLSRLQTSLADTSQAAIMPPSKQAEGQVQSTALVLKTKKMASTPVKTAVAPLARHQADRDDLAHSCTMPALLPMHVPLQSLSILHVGLLLQHHNLMPYIDPFARNCVDGVTLAVSSSGGLFGRPLPKKINDIYSPIPPLPHRKRRSPMTTCKS